MKYFNNLTRAEQNELRTEYKKTHKKDYSHSIHLFIIYVCFGILSLLSLSIMIFKNKYLGLLLFVLFFIMIIINIYFLTKSNTPFYKFLKEKGYKIKKK